MNGKTELMIVCDEKLMEYGNYIISLIGQNDDKENEVVGTKDGTVMAAIYTPKHYIDTLPKITSNTHILFIGGFKEAKEHRKNVEMKIDEFGMHYGWRGKRAVMYVDDKALKADEYNQFLSFATENQKEFEAVTSSFIKNIPDAVKFLSFPAVALFPVLVPVAIGGLIAGSIDEHRKIKEQQYRCLTMLTYLRGLKEFVEG